MHGILRLSISFHFLHLTTCYDRQFMVRIQKQWLDFLLRSISGSRNQVTELGSELSVTYIDLSNTAILAVVIVLVLVIYFIFCCCYPTP